MNEKSINRIEKKYLITKSQKRELLQTVKYHLAKDGYHKSIVQNLYFDNDNFDLITQSIDWVDFKEKVRARSYEGYDRVFLELKTKLHATASNKQEKDYEFEENPGYKRRVMITRSDFDKLINHQASLPELAAKSEESKSDLQIAKEIDYLLTHFDLRPQIFITYHRESYKNEENLRITFDEELKYRNQNLSFDSGKHDKIYFKDNRNIIMEIKAKGALPLWLVQKLSELKLYPERFSKIGKVYEKIRKEQNV
ncbi:polyphosphate polymerase domain-containing protein [Candidatus Saccharibacteria bacterium]|nr:polyphosphate polymerase domain-containing protein [Candidatus Saccharibacteria bacterium]